MAPYGSRLLAAATHHKNAALKHRLWVSRRYFADNNSPNKMKRNPLEEVIIAVGIVGTIGVATIFGIKNNENFRESFIRVYPYGSEIVKVICSENDDSTVNGPFYVSVLHHIKDILSGSLNTMKNKLSFETKESADNANEKKESARVTESKSVSEPEIKSYEAPKPVFEQIESDKKKLPEGHHEIRQIDPDITKQVETIGKIEPEDLVKNMEGCDYDPAKLAELESKLNNLVSKAIESYTMSIEALKNYSESVESLIDATTDFDDDNLWIKLDKDTQTKNEWIYKSEELGNQACQIRNRLTKIFADTKLNIDNEHKKQVQRNMKHLFEDLSAAQHQFDSAKERTGVTQKYWQQVKKARELFVEELDILFPDVDFSKPIVHFTDTDNFDLFLIYMQKQFMLLNKMNSKLSTVTEAKVKEALSFEEGDKAEQLSSFLANQMYERLKNNLEREYEKRAAELKSNNEREFRKQLVIQNKANMDHLTESLMEQKMDLEEQFTQSLNTALQKERERYHIRLAELIGRLVTIETSLKRRTMADRFAKKAQLFWSACENLYSSVIMANTLYGPKQRFHLISYELETVRNSADENDDFVQSVLESIPAGVIANGIYTEEGLRDRFVKVEQMVRRLALVPENGASLYTYVVSYFQATFMKSSITEIPEKELSDELTNFNSLDTFEIIARARYWMDRGDFPQVLRYMNLLNGAPRKISQDWIDELRKFVEMKLAAKALMAHATANGLVNLELLS